MGAETPTPRTEPITVAELMQHLMAYPANAIVVGMKDPEGNGCAPITEIEPVIWTQTGRMDGFTVSPQEGQQPNAALLWPLF